MNLTLKLSKVTLKCGQDARNLHDIWNFNQFLRRKCLTLKRHNIFFVVNKMTYFDILHTFFVELSD